LNKTHILSGKKIFGCPLVKQPVQVEERLQMLLKFKKPSSTVGAIISSVIQGNVCSESHNGMCFQSRYADLWPYGFKSDMLLLLINATPHVTKAAPKPSVSYPKLMHVMGVVPALHRVCETIRVLYPTVDMLLAHASVTIEGLKSCARFTWIRGGRHNQF
jgi:hypothetical protein